jgi:GT2 family glycosyltransferase
VASKAGLPASIWRPTCVLDAEITTPLDDFTGLRHTAARVVVRVYGFPVGEIRVPVIDGACRGEFVRAEALRQLARPIAHRLAAIGAPSSSDALHWQPADPESQTPDATDVTVAVCTRNRPDDLARCLQALDCLTPPPAEIIVVDNAPSDNRTQQVVEAHRRVRYVREPRLGLDIARNRAIAETHTAIIAFTDDDVVVDARWAGAVAAAFHDDPATQAVTGPVLPLELEHEAQILFERYGGFGRGFTRRWYRLMPGQSAVAEFAGAGQFGTGANMSFRRSLFAEIGSFDPALDVGTPTNGGGDLDMFYRVVRAGHVLAYEPSALVRHRHRRTYDELATQLTNNGIGFYAYLTRNAVHDPAQRRAFVYVAVWWFWHWSLRRLAISYLKPGKFPRDLIAAELWGSLRGPFRYFRARRDANEPAPAGIARRAAVREQLALSPRQRSEAEAGRRLRDPNEVVELVRLARRRFQIPAATEWPALPAHVSVSIVVPTFDRPESLLRCLRSLSALETPRRIEIVVVDNHPASAVTPRIVSAFPNVRLIDEPRRGLSFARNAGIRAARGDIIVATDDDVTAPPGWIESLVAPFVDPEVMVVTGNVGAADLSRESHRLFEAYGGLGRGDQPQRVDGDWFWAFRQAVPTWLLGATANAAFRATIFSHPRIGLLDEALGAGTPTGCSEDTYLFYKVLRAGFAIRYEPDAFVWHHHRSDVGSLVRQIYAYAKGHVAYHLTTLLRDGDLRALHRVFVGLPRSYASRVRDRRRGRSEYPNWLIAVELVGILVGPFALWRSRLRARRLRRAKELRHVVPSEADVLEERAS